MYSYYNPSPYGKNVGDCTVRAISKANGKDWGETYLALAIQGYLDGDMPSANATWGAYLHSLGYRRYIVPDSCPSTRTRRRRPIWEPFGQILCSVRTPAQSNSFSRL